MVSPTVSGGSSLPDAEDSEDEEDDEEELKETAGAATALSAIPETMCDASPPMPAACSAWDRAASAVSIDEEDEVRTDAEGGSNSRSRSMHCFGLRPLPTAPAMLFIHGLPAGPECSNCANASRSASSSSGVQPAWLSALWANVRMNLMRQADAARRLPRRSAMADQFTPPSLPAVLNSSYACISNASYRI